MMFGLGIHYLNGWAMAAADGAKKERVEWPPHPDRIFMAMAAAWFETGQSQKEKSALEWLEQLPPPNLAATDAEIRHELNKILPVTSFVPVNDSGLSSNPPETFILSKLKEAGLSLLPEFRSRQPRKFPVAIPNSPEVYLIWKEQLPDEHRQAIIYLCQNVISIGHSASLVQMWLTDSPPEPTLVPMEGVAPQRLRVFGPGRLEYLKARYNRENIICYRDAFAAVGTLSSEKKALDQKRKNAVKELKGAEKKAGEAPFRQQLEELDKLLQLHQQTIDSFNGQVPSSHRPEPGLWQGYGPLESEPSSDIPQGSFDNRLIVMELSGKRVGLHTTLKLTEAIRGALLAFCQQPYPEWLSGHREDGSPSREPHLAILPLPFVQHEHADGRIMGVALAVPKAINPNEAGRLLEPWLRDEYGLPRPIKLFDGQWFECRMELETSESPPKNLRTWSWVRPSRQWASVTPVVLDRHFDGKDKWSKAAEIVKDSCERIGLPRPEQVLLHPVSLAEGAPHSREFPPIKRKKDGGRMHHCHAVIVFTEPVGGPVIVGAGRFRGYGLCRPMDKKEARHG